jgi:hypothetical protein
VSSEGDGPRIEYHEQRAAASIVSGVITLFSQNACRLLSSTKGKETPEFRDGEGPPVLFSCEQETSRARQSAGTFLEAV